MSFQFHKSDFQFLMANISASKNPINQLFFDNSRDANDKIGVSWQQKLFKIFPKHGSTIHRPKI